MYLPIQYSVCRSRRPALAVLDVGLDDVAAVAHAHVPRVALGELLGHELRLGAGHDVAPEALAGLVVERLVAPQVAAFEDRGADRQVGLGHRTISSSERLE
jgi:hypothetical protein